MNQESHEKRSLCGDPSRPVTHEMLYARTLELALLAGRSSHEINQVDYERAKYELTGEVDFDRQQALVELAMAY